jgi:hypothetical protein
MLPKRTPLQRPPLPRPEGALDPRLEAAAAQALETRRGRPVRRTGAPQAGAVVARIVKPLAKGPPAAGRSLEELRRQWRDIVGEKLAPMTEPEKLAASGKNRVLTIKVAGPAAPFVQHQIPLLLERCNLAGAALTGISLKQGVLTRPKGNVRPLKTPLSADEEQLLAASLDATTSPRLKAALLRIGRGMGQRRV